jgi:hypothetical protein
MGYARQDPPLTARYYVWPIPPGFRVRARVRFRSGAIVKTGTAWAVPAAEEPAIFIFRANSARHLVGISAGIGSNRQQKIILTSNGYGIRRLSARGTKDFIPMTIFISRPKRGRRFPLIQGRADSTWSCAEFISDKRQHLCKSAHWHGAS